MKIVIIDYDMGNVRSISNAVRHIGYESVEVSGDHEKIQNADCLILPGVGAFRDAIQHLEERKLIDVLNKAVVKGRTPILGICLGMQLLFETSEEGGFYQGLGWINGNVIKMPAGNDLRIPHVGWNRIIIQNDREVFAGIGEDLDFYFVHSFFANCSEENIVAKFEYGRQYTAAVRKGNIWGMQFHPEKSQKNGFTVLRNFMKYSNMLKAK